MDKRIYGIAGLTVVAILLTIIRESQGSGETGFSLLTSPKQAITGEVVNRMADTTLLALGIVKSNIRHLKNRNDIRVLMPPTFDPIDFVKSMKDSLGQYNAEIVSMENAREKTTIVQVKTNESILKSFIFSKEPVTLKKGVSPSAQKKQAR